MDQLAPPSLDWQLVQAIENEVLLVFPLGNAHVQSGLTTIKMNIFMLLSSSQYFPGLPPKGERGRVTESENL